MGYSIHILYRTVARLTRIVTFLPICCAASSQAPCQAKLLRAHLTCASLRVAGACTVCRSWVLHVRLARAHELQVEDARDEIWPRDVLSDTNCNVRGASLTRSTKPTMLKVALLCLAPLPYILTLIQGNSILTLLYITYTYYIYIYIYTFIGKTPYV